MHSDFGMTSLRCLFLFSFKDHITPLDNNLRARFFLTLAFIDILCQSRRSDQHAAVHFYHLGSSKNMILISAEYSWISLQPCFKSDA